MLYSNKSWFFWFSFEILRLVNISSSLIGDRRPTCWRWRWPGRTLDRQMMCRRSVWSDEIYEHLEAGDVALHRVPAVTFGRLVVNARAATSAASVTRAHAACLLAMRFHVVIQSADVIFCRAQIAAQIAQVHLFHLKQSKSNYKSKINKSMQ